MSMAKIYVIINKSNDYKELNIILSSEYAYILKFLIISFIISFIMFSIAFLLSMITIKDSEKLSEYEYGFEPFDNATRQPFGVHFYIVAILFP